MLVMLRIDYTATSRWKFMLNLAPTRYGNAWAGTYKPSTENFTVFFKRGDKQITYKFLFFFIKWLTINPQYATIQPVLKCKTGTYAVVFAEGTFRGILLLDIPGEVG